MHVYQTGRKPSANAEYAALFQKASSGGYSVLELYFSGRGSADNQRPDQFDGSSSFVPEKAVGHPFRNVLWCDTDALDLHSVFWICMTGVSQPIFWENAMTTR